MSGLRCAPAVDATALHWECTWPRVPYISVIRIGWTLWRYMPSRYTVSGEVPCYGAGRGALFGGGGGVNQDWLAHRPIPEVVSSKACVDSFLRHARELN